ncbi:MAG: D-2-hydroxyacid dehydrogenase [Longimicrobiales bacterium]|nr:D-2-hydroxyacid dehydrogenase [Longimicrobiales bacterium]
MARLVIDMNDQRPVWARPRWFEEEIREALPDDWSLAMLDAPVEGTGDGSTAAHPVVLEAVADAEVYMGFGIHAEVILAGPGIRWVHSGSAGVGSSITPALLERNPVFTNTAGIHGPPMADTVVGMILHFFRGFDFAVEAQRRAAWDTSRFYAADCPIREVAGSTIGIIGFGGVGREVSARMTALGSRVLGLRRRLPDGASSRRGDAEGVEVVAGAAGLERLLRESDAVVVTAPDTPETRGMIDAEALSRMKPDAILINVARGAIVDEAALAEALRTRQLRGAGLDVFSTEPLSRESPFWGLDNLLITPHVSAVTDRFWRREADLILHNLRAWIAGDDAAMRNRVDLRAGY